MSYVATLSNPLIQQYTADKLDKNESRFTVAGALKQFQMQTNAANSILTPSVRDDIKKSAGLPVRIPVINAQDVTIGNTRSCTISTDEATSAFVTLTFFTMVSKFTCNRAQAQFNFVKYQEDYNRKLRNLIIAWMKSLDTACRNSLETNKNIYFPSEITNYYPVVGNALQIPLADQNDAMNKMTSILNQMDMYYAPPGIVASTSMQYVIERIKNQSSGNAINQAFQLAPYDNWSWSNRVTNNSSIANTFYALPMGNVAIENRNLPDNIMRSSIPNFKEWGEVDLPYLDMKVGTFYMRDCADGSAFTGEAILTQTLMDYFEFSSDFCIVTAYNSNPSGTYSPIIKAEISAT